MNSELIEFLKNLDEWPSADDGVKSNNPHVMASYTHLDAPKDYAWMVSANDGMVLVSPDAMTVIYKDDWQNVESFKPINDLVDVSITIRDAPKAGEGVFREYVGQEWVLRGDYPICGEFVRLDELILVRVYREGGKIIHEPVTRETIDTYRGL